MKLFWSPLILLFSLSISKCAVAQYLDRMILPTVAALRAEFQRPAPEYGPTVTWGWQGAIDTATIKFDLNRIKNLGFQMVTIEGGYRMPFPYLSDGYFKLIKFAVQAAKKRGLKVWIIDEGKYPSGFAGGLFSKERPDLRMQALIPMGEVKVQAGTRVKRSLENNVVSAVAYNEDTSILIPVIRHQLVWEAPQGADFKIILAGHAFRTSPTRSSNNPSGAKDTANSLMDYLNPAATKQFIQFTHEQYKKYIGEEFGKTVVGFRSDEPAFSYTPWTSGILELFKEEKGYDVQPYLAAFFLHNPSPEIERIKADYWDIFSGLFRDNFFKIIAGWCKKNHLQYEAHLDKDGPEDHKTMMDLVRMEGDYFEDMRFLQIPGIDVIWHQLWPGEANNFPKLASSSAHLNGNPQTFSESFAAYRPVPDLAQLKWILNEQMVRGINLFEIMFYPSSTEKNKELRGFMALDSFPQVMKALHRKSYLLSNGIPAAKIGLYFPTSSLWLKDSLSNQHTWKVAKDLLEAQLDFDFIYEGAMGSSLQVIKNGMKNRSNQLYNAILIPQTRIISYRTLKFLKRFKEKGGLVLFTGGFPESVKKDSFKDAQPFIKEEWPFEKISNRNYLRILRAGIPVDVQMADAEKDLKYLHRHLEDGELYFFFNEGESPVSDTAKLLGVGQVQEWYPESGKSANLEKYQSDAPFTRLPLELKSYQTKVIIIKSRY